MLFLKHYSQTLQYHPDADPFQNIFTPPSESFLQLALLYHEK